MRLYFDSWKIEKKKHFILIKHNLQGLLKKVVELIIYNIVILAFDYSLIQYYLVNYFLFNSIFKLQCTERMLLLKLWFDILGTMF